jgi:PAS domain S-box-containing protein
MGQAAGRVLLVEDEYVIAEDVRVCLSRYGYTVIGPVGEGEAVKDVVSAESPDLILMDIKLGGTLSGIDTAVEIKETFDIPIVFLTALSDKDIIEKIKDVEAYGYIVKPYEEAELVGVIKSAVQKHGSDRKIRVNESWLITTLKSIGDGVLTVDNDCRITFMNNVAEELTGWNIEDAKGRHFSEVFVSRRVSSGDDVSPIVERVIREGRAESLPDDVLLRQSGGDELFIEDRLSPIQDEAGRVSGAVLVFRDVSERRKAAEAVRRSEGRYRLLLDTLPQGVQEIDLDGNILYVNTAYERLFGYRRDEILGKKIYDFQPDRKSSNELAAYLRFLRATEPEPTRWTGHNKTKDGGILDVEVDWNYLRDSEGRINGFLVSITDVTESRATKRRAEFHALMLDAVGQAVIATKPDGTVIFGNEAVETIYGWRPDEIIGRNIFSLTIPEGSEVLDQAQDIMARLRRGDVWNGEFTVRRKDGSTFPAIVSDAPVFDETGNLSAIIGVTTNISRLKEANRETAKNLEEKELLLQELHHRVKNSLQLISSLLSIQCRYVPEKRLLRYFNNIRNRIRTMALVYDTLYQKADLRNINLPEYMGRIVYNIYGSLSSVQIEFSAGCRELFVNLERAVPYGLLLNELISSSINHAVPEPGAKQRIEIECAAETDGRVRLKLRDNGKEIEENNDAAMELKLIEIMAKEQLGGTLSRRYENGNIVSVVFSHERSR